MTGPDVVTIYGHQVELQSPGEGYVSDVIVLARSVALDEDGDPEDSLLISESATVTGLVGTGIVTTAAHIFCAPERKEDE